MTQSDKGMPQIGMIFKSREEAWLFWVAYGGRVGFDVRKRYTNVSKFDGKVTSCRYVCANEGHRKKTQRESIQKCFRAETRTDCKARMTLTLDRGTGNLEVTDVVLEHNHLLHLPQTRHLMVSQRKISEFQAYEIEAADDSGIRPKAAYELATCQKSCGDSTFEDERIVIGDPCNQTATCTCGMFERAGVLCGHGLKVLDLMNIKTLPTHYVLKRWTREACKGSILDRQGRNVVENPKLEAMLRYKELSHKFHSIAFKIAYSTECCVLLENALDSVGPKLEEKLNASTSAMNEPSHDQENADPNAQQRDDFLRAAQLKKKEVQPKNSKRKKNWLDKLHKAKRKATKPAVSTKKGPQQKKKNADVHPQVEVKNDGNKRSTNVEHEQYIAIESFTRLLTAPPTCEDDRLYGGNLF